MFDAERPGLIPHVGPFDHCPAGDGEAIRREGASTRCQRRCPGPASCGLHSEEEEIKVQWTFILTNRDSVDARAVGRPVEIRACADRLECWQDGQVVARHDRAFGRNNTVCDPLHDIPVLARKPGASRNGAPFKGWEQPPALRRVRRKLERQPGGDRQVVEILGAVLTDGLDAVEAACAEALAHNVHSAGVVLNILARHHARGVLPARRTAATPDDHDTGCAEAGPRACGQLRPP